MPPKKERMEILNFSFQKRFQPRKRDAITIKNEPLPRNWISVSEKYAPTIPA